MDLQPHEWIWWDRDKTHQALKCYDAWGDQSYAIPLTGPDEGYLFKRVNQYRQGYWRRLYKVNEADMVEFNRRRAKPVRVNLCKGVVR